MGNSNRKVGSPQEHFTSHHLDFFSRIPELMEVWIMYGSGVNGGHEDVYLMGAEEI